MSKEARGERVITRIQQRLVQLPFSCPQILTVFLFSRAFGRRVWGRLVLQRSVVRGSSRGFSSAWSSCRSRAHRSCR